MKQYEPTKQNPYFEAHCGQCPWKVQAKSAKERDDQVSLHLKRRPSHAD